MEPSGCSAPSASNPNGSHSTAAAATRLGLSSPFGPAAQKALPIPRAFRFASPAPVARRHPPMKRFITPFARTLLAVALPLTAAAMNNKDVIKMQKAGLSEETIISAIQKEPADYDTKPDGLIELKSAGVTEKIIQKMIAMQSGDAAGGAQGAGTSNAPASGGFTADFPSIAPPKITPVAGKDYFTRYTMHEEKNEHSTTNYSRGATVPINTPVQLVSMSGSQLVLKRLDNGQQLKVKNEDKFTKKSIPEIASLMLSSDKTPLEKLPEDVATAVRNGDMRKGMTKELVLMARGYPPAHETPSIEGDRWVYWSSRFVKQTIVFSNGRLSEGRGLY
jgi:hypothetical protein